MDDDLLTRAAAKLREFAKEAKKGPWVVRHDSLWFTLRSDAEFEYGYEADIVDIHSPDDTWPDFNYMALMHPPVALALADLLDLAADWRSSVPADAFEDVARAILRESRGGAA